MNGDEPSTEQLQAEQTRRERIERELARGADEDSEQIAHARRAEKASYLRQKLNERERSEREVESRDDD